MRSFVTSILVLSAPTFTAADDPPKAAQASFEPRSTPGAGQALLAKFAGDWDVVKTFHPRQGEPVTSRGTCRQAMIHDGRFLQSDFTFEVPGGKPTTGRGEIGFEPESGVFTSVWTDSRQTRMSFRQSRDKFDGRTIVLYSQSLDPPTPGRVERRSKTVTKLEDDGKTLLHRQYALGDKGEERLMMELKMTRKER